VEGSERTAGRASIGDSERSSDGVGSLPYRPDIDGLRGLAVLLVIAFHFGIWPISGGYIGVDIFFVISGYLITSLLLQPTTFWPALDDFYRRRIIRLMPMLLVVMAVCAIVVSFLFTPDDFVNYFQSVTQVLVARANLHFDHVTQDYFSQDAHILPLLHTWSLSIEWQFYLMFPAAFLIARKYCSLRTIGMGLACLTLVLFVVSCVKTGTSQQSYFLGLPRYFEPLAGCVAALVKLPMGEPLKRVIAVACAASLIALATIYDNATAFPGVHAGIVCFLSALLIVTAQGNVALGFSPLVRVGRISYSAYLWHWPPLAFLNYMEMQLSKPAIGVLIIAVLITAQLSYTFIEKPARQLRHWPLWKLIVLFVALPLAISYGVKELSQQNDGFYQRLGAESVSIHRAMEPYLDKKNCLHFRRNEGQDCHLGVSGPETSLYLIGDSHAGHFRYFADTLAKDAGIGGTSITRIQCLMVPGAETLSKDDKCRIAAQNSFDRIAAAKPKYVMLGEHWISYPMADVRKLDGLIESFVRQSITPIILGPVAENGTDLKSCFYRHVRLGRTYQGDCQFKPDNEFTAGRTAEVHRFFDELKLKYPQIVFIDIEALECPSGICDPQIDGVPVYDDRNHINGYGSVALARRYLSMSRNPLQR
jgi:peptidoglycan/LPS O-acetylase OafA/YrhL